MKRIPLLTKLKLECDLLNDQMDDIELKIIKLNIKKRKCLRELELKLQKIVNLESNLSEEIRVSSDSE